mmetsp:Transcript_4564/g.13805  ORF Transcript_4564/g.13805 Transcript_4564/m.13805 type:complete len:117 (-) Transcript_4564:307-657(-)
MSHQLVARACLAYRCVLSARVRRVEPRRFVTIDWADKPETPEKNAHKDDEMNMTEFERHFSRDMTKSLRVLNRTFQVAETAMYDAEDDAAGWEDKTQSAVGYILGPPAQYISASSV